MANESTYASMSGLVNPIWETALLTLSEQSIMPRLVRNFTDVNSSTPRQWAQYTGGTIQTVAETADLAAQTFTPAAAGTLTPTQFGIAYFLTDQRIASDPFGAQPDAGADLGRVIAVKIDTDLVGNFANFTGGTVGTAGGTLTWANVQRASAYIKTAYGPGPYACVLHPVQWYYLTSATSGVPTLMQSQTLMDQFGRNFYQASWAGIDFFVDGNITSGTAAKGGMFSRDAIAFDQRRALRIEPQRDASRGGGGFELNATIIYAQGLYRPTFGCLMTGTSS
jgi:hypothetical protein